MRLKADVFKAWADSKQPGGGPVTWKTIAAQAGTPMVTVLRQKTKDALDPRLVLRISRTMRCDPLQELASFPGYEVLRGAPPRPTEGEILTQVCPRGIFHEISARLHEEDRSTDPPLSPWGGFAYAFVSWVSWAGPRNYNELIRRRLEISTTAVAKKLSQPQVLVEQVIPVCSAVDLDPVLALVILGHITDEEAGLAPDLRESVLRRCAPEDLVSQLQHVERFLRRRLHIAEVVDEVAARA